MGRRPGAVDVQSVAFPTCVFLGLLNRFLQKGFQARLDLVEDFSHGRTPFGFHPAQGLKKGRQFPFASQEPNAERLHGFEVRAGGGDGLLRLCE